MKRSRNQVLAALFVSLTTVAGCHTTSPNLGTPPTPPPAEKSTLLSAKQKAELKVANAQCLDKPAQENQAINAYHEALALDANSYDALVGLAVLYDKRGKNAESLPLYQKALKVRPGSADLFCKMGFSLYLQQRYAEAEINFRQAIAIDNGFAAAHNNLGMVLAHKGDHAQALAEFRLAGCSRANAHCNLACCLILDGQLDQARQQYEQARAVDPNSAQADRGLRKLEQLAVRTAKQ